MDNKKYQVFVSSTYIDLAEERKKIFDVLLSADCIPAGMEAFHAADEEQFNIIKQVIDLCDYYILIIGNRYGSINEKTNRSYTEMEYEYAIEKNIPVLVFSINNKSESNEDKIHQGKLEEFKQKALKNRLASVCNDVADLSSKVAISIMKAIKEIKRPGWQRVNCDYHQLLETIADLTRKNNALEENLILHNKDLEKFDENSLNEIINLVYFEYHFVFTSATEFRKLERKASLKELFQMCSIKILGKMSLRKFNDAFDVGENGSLFKLDSDISNKILAKFEKLNLIKVDYDKETLCLSEQGKIVRDKLNSI